MRFTPIVIGYGGNDGSLMGTLASLPPKVPESIYWCQREGSSASARVTELLEQRKGKLVSIPGFDELMLMLQSHMQLDWETPDLLEEMAKRQRERENSYKEQRDKIGAALAASPRDARGAAEKPEPRRAATAEERDLADAAVRVLAPKGDEKPWWQWDLEANRETDLDKKDKIFHEGLQMLPNSSELLGSYALFLQTERKDFERAEEFYRRAIEADPKNAIALGNYAALLQTERKDFERAEEF